MKVNLECISLMESEAGYLLWIKLDKIKDTLDFLEKLAKETGVLVVSGTRFVGNEDGYIRINIATSKLILEESMRKLANFYLKI